MGFSSAPFNFVERFASAIVLTTVTLGAGTWLYLTKQTPTVALRNEYLIEGKSSSGAGFHVDGWGTAVFSGAVVSDGVTLSTGAVLTVSIADSRYVNTSGDTMTGALKVVASISGTTLHADDFITSSGTLAIEGQSFFRSAVNGIAFDELEDLSANKTFNNGSNSVSFNFTNPTNQPTYDGAFEIQSSGAFEGDLFHVHQHTGNPGIAHLAHFQADDADVLPLRVMSAGTWGLVMSGGLLVEAADSTIQGNLSLTGTLSGASLKMSSISPRCAIGQISGSGQTLGTGSGKNALNIPSIMSGYTMKFAELGVGTAGATNATSVQARLIRGSTTIGKMFSTVISVDSAEWSSTTAAAAYAINFSAATVQGGDVIQYDVPAVSTTPPKIVQLTQCFFAP